MAVKKLTHIYHYSPESVSHPIFEGQVTKLIHDEYVSRTEEHVTLLEDVRHNLLCGGCGVLVALEFLDGVSPHNLSNELPRLTRICQRAETVLVSNGFSCNLCSCSYQIVNYISFFLLQRNAKGVRIKIILTCSTTH